MLAQSTYLPQRERERERGAEKRRRRRRRSEEQALSQIYRQFEEMWSGWLAGRSQIYPDLRSGEEDQATTSNCWLDGWHSAQLEEEEN